MVETQIFILHWSSTTHIYPNYFTLEAIRSIQELTDGSYEITVVDNYSDDDAINDLILKLPSDVVFVKNDRPSRSVNSGRNKIWSLVDADYFAVLHTDVRVSKGWLRNMLAELKMAEERYQKPCVVSPLSVPYFIGDNSLYRRFSSHFTVDTLEKLEAYCKSFGIPFENGHVSSKPCGFYTDDGHQLMIFLASKNFRDKVGEWDEQYVGGLYDDCDMGMTAILKGCKNLQSQTVYLQHLQGISIGFGHLHDAGVNQERFIEKWGKETFDELSTGSLWKKLHKEHP